MNNGGEQRKITRRQSWQNTPAIYGNPYIQFGEPTSTETTQFKVPTTFNTKILPENIFQQMNHSKKMIVVERHRCQCLVIVCLMTSLSFHPVGDCTFWLSSQYMSLQILRYIGDLQNYIKLTIMSIFMFLGLSIEIIMPIYYYCTLAPDYWDASLYFVDTRSHDWVVKAHRKSALLLLEISSQRGVCLEQRLKLGGVGEEHAEDAVRRLLLTEARVVIILLGEGNWINLIKAFKNEMVIGGRFILLTVQDSRWSTSKQFLEAWPHFDQLLLTVTAHKSSQQEQLSQLTSKFPKFPFPQHWLRQFWATAFKCHIEGEKISGEQFSKECSHKQSLNLTSVAPDIDIAPLSLAVHTVAHAMRKLVDNVCPGALVQSLNDCLNDPQESLFGSLLSLQFSHTLSDKAISFNETSGYRDISLRINRVIFDAQLEFDQIAEWSTILGFSYTATSDLIMEERDGSLGMLCLVSILFVMPPNAISCAGRRTTFSIALSAVFGPILVKTISIWRSDLAMQRGSLRSLIIKNSNIMFWTCLGITVIQCVISTEWAIFESVSDMSFVSSLRHGHAWRCSPGEKFEQRVFHSCVLSGLMILISLVCSTLSVRNVESRQNILISVKRRGKIIAEYISNIYLEVSQRNCSKSITSEKVNIYTFQQSPFWQKQSILPLRQVNTLSLQRNYHQAATLPQKISTMEKQSAWTSLLFMSYVFPTVTDTQMPVIYNHFLNTNYFLDSHGFSASKKAVVAHNGPQKYEIESYGSPTTHQISVKHLNLNLSSSNYGKEEFVVEENDDHAKL
uniref:G_PROTEIN_RECEP_F3_4 domain-containing protein n=1 Tax=Heterorhabditis bacteriophora TaxID=37862 RepID=A0A1I7X272_HETBA